METQKRIRIATPRAVAQCALAVTSLLAAGGCPPSVVPDGAGQSTKPTVTAPADQTVECDGSGNQVMLNAWLNSATFSEGCGGGTLRNDFQALVQRCAATGGTTVTWTVTDRCGNSASDSAVFTIVDASDPALSVPQPISVTCGEPGTADALAAWRARGTATDVCGNVAIISERFPAPGDCQATITWTATDDCGNAVSLSSTYATNGDTTSPTLALVGDAEITVECGDAWQDPGVSFSDDCDALLQAELAGEVELRTPGWYVLSYSAVDACGNAATTLARTVTVVDTTPPVVTLGTPPSLWPPNHQLQTLTLAELVTVKDACEGELDANVVGNILDIYSDEPDNDTGDGNTDGDIVIVDNHTFSVRVERKGNGNGRVYGVRFEVSDSSGNTVEATAFVHVPHDQSGGAVLDDGPAGGHVVTR